MTSQGKGQLYYKPNMCIRTYNSHSDHYSDELQHFPRVHRQGMSKRVEILVTVK